MVTLELVELSTWVRFPYISHLFMKPNKKIVVVGGGTGVFAVLSGLKKYPVHLTAVVTMADDGGSTGLLREEFGILPPGDIRRALIALSNSDNKILSELFNYRFKEGSGLRGHSFGNLMLTALERITGSFSAAICEAEKILSVQGNVLPVTLSTSRLVAKLQNDKLIKGETNIDIPTHDGRLKIIDVWLEPVAKINQLAARAIREADVIVIGPGDLYTSIMPNLLVTGFKEALHASRAKKIYAVNIMTKFGETNHFIAEDFLRVVMKVIGEDTLDYVLINTKKPNLARLKKYAEERAEFVELGKLPDKPLPILGDFLRGKGFLRHDPDKLAKTILFLL